VLGQPALRLGHPAGQAERQAFLAEQGISAIARPDRPDGVLGREVHDEAAIGAQVAERVQAPGEHRIGRQVVQGDRAHAGHDPHVQHDVLAVGDLDARLGEAGTGHAHEERHDIERAAPHRTGEERRQFGLRVGRQHPVVVRPDLLGTVRANEREVFGSRHVVRRAPMEVAAGQTRLIERDELAGRQALRHEAVAFGFGSVAVDDGVGGSELGYLIHPRGHHRGHCHAMRPPDVDAGCGKSPGRPCCCRDLRRLTRKTPL
jgi:hypothetical protein